MKVRFLRKILIALASLSVPSLAVAAMDIDSRVTQLEQKMKQVHTETAIETNGAKTATARADVNGHGVYGTVDLIVWHLRNPASGYALTDSVQTPTFPIEGRIHAIEFDWSAGFRVGLGYNFDHDGWDAGVEYTYFNTTDTSSESGGDITPIRTWGIAPLGTNPKPHPDSVAHFRECTSAKSTYDFNFQNVEANLGRAFFVSKMLSFRPFLGVKTAWLSNTQHTTYKGGEVWESRGADDPSGLPANSILYGLQDNPIKEKEKNNFWGVGPQVGCGSKWHLGAGFSIFGDLSAALLYGFTKLEHEERYSLFHDFDDYIDVKYSFHRIAPTVKMQLGLRYDAYVNHDKHHFGIGLGYDTQYWWDQAQHGMPAIASNLTAPIAMYGFTLDFRFDW